MKALPLSRRCRLASFALLAGMALSILPGCAPQLIPATTTLTGYDFSTYSAKGFLFTPESYPGAYESVGLLTVTLTPSVRYDRDEDAVLALGEKRIGNVIIGRVQADSAISVLHAEARARGADAITRFLVQAESYSVRGLDLVRIHVSGFAIRRLEGP